MASNEIKAEFLHREDQVRIELDGQLQTVEVAEVFNRWDLVFINVVGRREPITLKRGEKIEVVQQTPPPMLSTDWAIGASR